MNTCRVTEAIERMDSAAVPKRRVVHAVQFDEWRSGEAAADSGSRHGSAHRLAIRNAAVESLMSYTRPTTSGAMENPSIGAQHSRVIRICMFRLNRSERRGFWTWAGGRRPRRFHQCDVNPHATRNPSQAEQIVRRLRIRNVECKSSGAQCRAEGAEMKGSDDAIQPSTLDFQLGPNPAT